MMQVILQTAMTTANTQVQVPMLYFAIIGRRKGDATVTCHFQESPSTELALHAFEDVVAPDRHETGAQVEVLAALCSETPIATSELDFQAITQLQDPKLLEAIIAEAQKNGESNGVAQQVQDLQNTARAMWKMATPSQKVALLRTNEVAKLMEQARGTSIPATLHEVHSADIADAMRSFGLDPTLPYSNRVKLDAVSHHRLLPESRPRFAYCEGWGHIFQGASETTTRWAWDTSSHSIVDAQYKTSAGWAPLDSASIKDLAESIKDNEAYDDIAAANLGVQFAAESGDLPEWVHPIEQNTLRERAGG